MNSQLKPALLGLLLALPVAALPVTASAQSAPAPAAPETHVTKNISGKITAKSDTSLVVDSRTVSLNSATTYSKSGAAIGSGDIKVGDSVNVVTTDDGQVAVSVTVTTSA
jgi:hypothetical protein